MGNSSNSGANDQVTYDETDVWLLLLVVSFAVAVVGVVVVPNIFAELADSGHMQAHGARTHTEPHRATVHVANLIKHKLMMMMSAKAAGYGYDIEIAIEIVF